jgi:hypothetical protein
LREELNIPEDATVFGRFGGEKSFDLNYAWRKIIGVAIDRPNIYFVFVNTNNFLDNKTKDLNLKNIIFLPRIIDEFPQYQKVKFINTCDAMIHARIIGEAFGIALGEFNIFNKPIITHASKRHNAHLTILGDKGIYYKSNNPVADENLKYDAKDLYEILTEFDKEKAKEKDWRGYKEYTPENVMKKFKEVFID